MALNFDYRECGEELTDEHYGQTVETVVFNTMFVGINPITEENYVQMAMRCTIHDAAQGALYGKTFPEWIEVIRPWVGLRTNASPMTDAAFYKRVREITEDTMRGGRVAEAVRKAEKGE